MGHQWDYIDLLAIDGGFDRFYYFIQPVVQHGQVKDLQKSFAL